MKNLKKRTGILALIAGMLSVAMPASAAFVQATFNDLNTGSLNGQAGGTGFSGNWAGSSGIPRVVGIDLTAPASTHFALTQTGNARSIDEVGTVNPTGTVPNVDRQRSRALATPLNGTIWLSFLVNSTSSATEVAGIGLNTPGGTSTFNDYPTLLAIGTDLVYNSNRSINPRAAVTTFVPVVAAGVVPATGDSLIVARIFLDPAGILPSRLDAWVNPDLTNMPAPQLTVNALEEIDPSFTKWNPVTAISRIAVGGTATPAGGGNVDFLTLSNGADAFYDVTGVPEPTAATLAGALVLGLARRNRR